LRVKKRVARTMKAVRMSLVVVVLLLLLLRLEGLVVVKEEVRRVDIEERGVRR
jgi:hypothetical protein